MNTRYVMHIGPPVQVDTDTWLIMREDLERPKAIVKRVRDVSGGERYMLMTWAPAETSRRLIGLFPSLYAADRKIPPPMRARPPAPPPPGSSREEGDAYLRQKGTTGDGWPSVP